LILAFLNKFSIIISLFSQGGTDTKDFINKEGSFFFFSPDLIPKRLLRNWALLIALALIIIPSPLFASQTAGASTLKTNCLNMCPDVNPEESLLVQYGTSNTETDTDIDIDDTGDGLDGIHGEGLTIDYPARIFRRGTGDNNEELCCREPQREKPDRAPPHFQIADGPYKPGHIYEIYFQKLYVYHNPRIKSEEITQRLTVFGKTRLRFQRSQFRTDFLNGRSIENDQQTSMSMQF